MSFVDEMNKIRRANANKPIVTNDRKTLKMFEEKGKLYIDEICEQIRSDIKAAAQKSAIYGDRNLRSRFQKGKLLNPHYLVYFRSAIRLNFDTSVFSYEPLKCHDPWKESEETRKSFVVNDAETIKYVLLQVEKQLSKDRIYYVVSRSTRETTTTQRSVLPIDEIVSQIKQQIAARKKDCNAYVKDIIIDWPFAYFI